MARSFTYIKSPFVGQHDSPVHTRRPITIPANKLGIHLLLDDGRNQWPTELWPEHLDYARQAVGEWGFVVQLIRQDDFDAVKWQQFMDWCAERQMTPIIRLATKWSRSAAPRSRPARTHSTRC